MRKDRGVGGIVTNTEIHKPTKGEKEERRSDRKRETLKFNPPTSVSESLRIRKTSCVGVPSTSLDNGNKMAVITNKQKKIHAWPHTDERLHVKLPLQCATL